MKLLLYLFRLYCLEVVTNLWDINEFNHTLSRGLSSCMSVLNDTTVTRIAANPTLCNRDCIIILSMGIEKQLSFRSIEDAGGDVTETLEVYFEK